MNLSAILKNLMGLLQGSSQDLAQEMFMADQALISENDAQVFRALEILVLSAHAAGITRNAELQHAPALLEAVQILRMGGKSLPSDLFADNA